MVVRATTSSCWAGPGSGQLKPGNAGLLEWAEGLRRASHCGWMQQREGRGEEGEGHLRGNEGAGAGAGANWKRGQQ
jgi:hypothetical protein